MAYAIIIPANEFRICLIFQSYASTIFLDLDGPA